MVTFRFTGWRAVAALVGLVAVLVSISLLQSVSEQQASGLVRQYLRYQVSQAYSHLQGPEAANHAAGRQYERELAAVDSLVFVKVEVGRLLPDYLFVKRPTFFARIEMREPSSTATTTRYFNLGRGAIALGESSARTWFWVY